MIGGGGELGVRASSFLWSYASAMHTGGNSVYDRDSACKSERGEWIDNIITFSGPQFVITLLSRSASIAAVLYVG
jgi:hypothetical protein